MTLLCTAFMAGASAPEAAAQEQASRLTVPKKVVKIAPSESRQKGLLMKNLIKNGQREAYMAGMKPFMTLRQAAEAGAEALPAPWTCTFDSEESMDYWSVIDGNGDGIKWTFSPEEGCAMCLFAWDGDTDDYLVSVHPVSLDAGQAYITVDYNGYSKPYKESFELMYGTTPDVSQMTVIATYDNFSMQDGGYTNSANFEVPAAGDYYFAIHGTSSGIDGLGLLIYGVTIGEGTVTGRPDVTISDVILPANSSALGSSEQIGARVTNVGTGAVSSFTLEASVNGTPLATQTFNVPIEPNFSVDVMFDATADFSQIGDYTVSVTATDVVQAEGMGPEEVTDNNSGEGSVSHLTVAEVPYTTDFSDADARSEWNGGSVWSYQDYYGAMVCTGTEPLVSKGIRLEAGKTYRLTYEYMAGMDNYIYVITEDWKVAFGPDGSEPLGLGWTVLGEYNDVYTDNTFTDGELYLTPAVSGDYSVCFVQDNWPGGTFFLKNVSLVEVSSDDVAVTAINKLPSMLPVGQIEGQKVDVTVLNRGGKPVSGTVRLDIDGDEAGSGTFIDLPSGESTDVEVTLGAVSCEAGQKTLKVTAELDGESDQVPENNTMTAGLEVTDKLFAYDYVTPDMYEYINTTGVSGMSSTVGISFRISQPAMLEAISLGWGVADGKMVTLHVYEWNQDVMPNAAGLLPVGDEVYNATVSQGTALGQMDYPLSSPLQLEAGDYMIAVTYTDFGLVVDKVAPGQLYMLSEVDDMGMMASDQSDLGFGTAAIRAVLGTVSTSINAVDGGADGGRVAVNVSGDVLTAVSAEADITAVSVYSASGAAVATAGGDGRECRVSVAGLPSGVYFAKVVTAAGTEVCKFAVR